MNTSANKCGSFTEFHLQGTPQDFHLRISFLKAHLMLIRSDLCSKLKLSSVPDDIKLDEQVNALSPNIKYR